MSIAFDRTVPIRHARPGLHDRPWGWRDMTIADPFGNTLVFSERIAECD